MNELFSLLLHLSQELKTIKAYLEVIRKTRMEILNESWMDGNDVARVLKISKRTLLTFRNNGTLSYSRLNGKIYYKLEDIQNLLENNYTNAKTTNNGVK